MRIPDSIDRNDHEAIANWLESDAFDPGDDELHAAAPLRRIMAASDDLDRAREHLHNEARTAQRAGVSWTTIGAVLGISRQAARQRFAEPTAPVPR